MSAPNLVLVRVGGLTINLDRVSAVRHTRDGLRVYFDRDDCLSLGGHHATALARYLDHRSDHLPIEAPPGDGWPDERVVPALGVREPDVAPDPIDPGAPPRIPPSCAFGVTEGHAWIQGPPERKAAALVWVRAKGLPVRDVPVPHGFRFEAGCRIPAGLPVEAHT